MKRLHPQPVVSGTGPSRLLIIHGWYGDHRVFDGLVAALDPERFTIARFDIRGYGQSHYLPGPFDLQQVATDALRIADQLGWKKFAVVGHSMGGKAAQRLAIGHPERISALAGITPVPATPLGFDAETASFFAQAAEDDGVAQSIVAHSAGSRRDARWVAALVADTRRTATTKAFAGYCRSFVEDDLSAGAAALELPVLILFGEEDRGVDHQILAPVYRELYPHAAIEVIPATGHYPMVDDAGDLARRLAGFVAS